MNWILVNLPFFLLIVFLAIRIIFAVRKGAVKEVCGVVSMILASILVMLIAFAVRQYFDSQRVIFIITIILILLLIIIYKIFNLAFTTMKLIAKLPGVNLVNKLLGIPLVNDEHFAVEILWCGPKMDCVQCFSVSSLSFFAVGGRVDDVAVCRLQH